MEKPSKSICIIINLNLPTVEQHWWYNAFLSRSLTSFPKSIQNNCIFLYDALNCVHPEVTP